MGFLRNRLLKRFSPLGRVADVLLVVGALLRFAQTKGWVSDEQAAQFGLSNASASGTSSALPMAQVALAGRAAWRLFRKKKKRSL